MSDRTPTRHRKFCAVDGGHLRHEHSGEPGLRGIRWRCPRCAEIGRDDYTELLLSRLDKYTGATR